MSDRPLSIMNTFTSCIPEKTHHFTTPPTHPPAHPLFAGHSEPASFQACLADSEHAPNMLPSSESALPPWINLLPMGVLLVSPQLELVYLNHQAQILCQQITTPAQPPQPLPLILEQVCHQLLERADPETALIAEYWASEHLHLRIQAQWMHLPPHPSSAHLWNRHLLLLLENRREMLQKELWLEQQKYDLTERESEIWSLLRQDYSYREIASLLQISLNTVKTHVKNVYAKKRSHQGREKLLIF